MFPCQVDKGKGKIKGPYEGNVEFSMEFHIIVFTAHFTTGLSRLWLCWWRILGSPGSGFWEEKFHVPLDV